MDEFIINKGLKNDVERIIVTSEKVISLLLYFSNVNIVVVGFPTSILVIKREGALTDSNNLKFFRSLCDKFINNLLFIISDEIKYIGIMEGKITWIKRLQMSYVATLKFTGYINDINK